MHNELINKILETRAATEIISKLQPLYSTARINRMNDVIKHRISSIQVAIEAPSNPHNAAAVVRSAESLGICSVHAIAAEGKALNAKGTTQGAFYWLDTLHHDNLSQFLALMQKQRVAIYGADISGDSELDELPVDIPCCVLFGNEARGLSDEALAHCHKRFRIPMYGMSQSYNLSVSAAITLYHLTREKRMHHLDENKEEQQALFAKYLLFDAKQELLLALFK